MTGTRPSPGLLLPLAFSATLLGGCSDPSDGSSLTRAVASTAPTASSSAAAAPRTPRPFPAPTRLAEPSPTAPPPSRGPEPRRSWVSVPALGLRNLEVVRYRGTPDDGPGTRIQNRGPAASPRGPGGGVGPGQVGNYIVTGHRTSHRAPFRDLPSVGRGDLVRVRSGEQVFVYRITDTRRTSFRSAASLRRQAAAVPGRPGKTAVRPMITLSTCATPEDHAAGNYWADEFDNPEHRIDKIGVLADTRAAG